MNVGNRMIDIKNCSVMKRLATIRQDAHTYYQRILLDAVEFYEKYHYDPMPKEASDFLKAAFLMIKETGLSVDNYSSEDLRIIHSLFVTATCWECDELITDANISDEFTDAVEEALEKEGVLFI